MIQSFDNDITKLSSYRYGVIEVFNTDFLESPQFLLSVKKCESLCEKYVMLN